MKIGIPFQFCNPTSIGIWIAQCIRHYCISACFVPQGHGDRGASVSADWAGSVGASAKRIVRASGSEDAHATGHCGTLAGQYSQSARKGSQHVSIVISLCSQSATKDQPLIRHFHFITLKVSLEIWKTKPNISHIRNFHFITYQACQKIWKKKKPSSTYQTFSFHYPSQWGKIFEKYHSLIKHFHFIVLQVCQELKKKTKQNKKH